MISIALSDPRESQLPNIGLITLEDAETGELVEVDTGSSGIRTDYQKQALRSRDIFNQQMRKRGLDWIEASTDQAYIPALSRLFARRATRN